MTPIVTPSPAWSRRKLRKNATLAGALGIVLGVLLADLAGDPGSYLVPLVFLLGLAVGRATATTYATPSLPVQGTGDDIPSELFPTDNPPSATGTTDLWVGHIHGIGPALAEKMEKAGVSTARDLVEAGSGYLAREVGLSVARVEELQHAASCLLNGDPTGNGIAPPSITPYRKAALDALAALPPEELSRRIEDIKADPNSLYNQALRAREPIQANPKVPPPGV